MRWYIVNCIEDEVYIVVVRLTSSVWCRQFIVAFLAPGEGGREWGSWDGGGGRRTSGVDANLWSDEKD